MLVVDDDRSTRNALRNTLQRDGFRVEEAADGAQALLLLKRMQPDVILMDAVMPVMDGFTACERIQELPKARAIPVSCRRSGAPVSGTNRSSGISEAHTTRTASPNSASLSPKWLYTVSLDTPAAVAIWSMLTPSKPCCRNMRSAASRIAARLARSLGRPGLAAGRASFLEGWGIIAANMIPASSVNIR